MKNSFYEVFVQPESGPCTVHERGFKGEVSWTVRDDAINTAKLKKEIYPLLNFVVHKVTGRNREVVFRTKP